MLSNLSLYNEYMKQVAVDKVIWSYIEITGKGTPIVILHGWGRSGSEWEIMGNDLHEKTGRPVLIPDLPGFGGTGMTQNITDIYDYTKSLVSWMTYLDIKRASIIGHSLGGRMVIVLGARYPELVESIVLIAPAAVKPMTFRRIILRPLRTLSRLIPRKIREFVSRSVSDVDGRNIKLRDLYKAVVKYDLAHELAKIKSSTLVVWGERDPILPLGILSVYKRQLPSAIVRVVWEAGHDPHLTHFRDLSRIVEEVWI